jgi:GT2 family glycosyltransferase
MKLDKKVAILLVLYNEEKYIERLAKSIVNQTYKNISIYAIDNNSSDSSLSLLLKYFPDANTISSKDNLGFAEGNNILAKKAINNNEDLLFILNTDMELDSDCISNLVEVISENDDVVGAGPIVFFGNNEGRTDNIQCYADKTNFTNARTRTLYTGSDISFEELPQKLFVNALHGGCFMIQSLLISEIGLFNKDNFMYNDEVDLAYRIHKRNGKLLVIKNAHAWHFHDWSKKNKTGYYLQYYYMNRNRFLFFYRHNKYLSVFREVLVGLFSFPLKIKWAKKTADLKLLKYYYLGYWHGLLNKKGKAKIEFK